MGTQLAPVGTRYLHEKSGYVHIVTAPGIRMLEHRFLMEQHLNRSLFPGENIHHKNGKRDDNRLSNLELWVTFQPSGQRVEDLLTYADEIINRYRKN